MHIYIYIYVYPMFIAHTLNYTSGRESMYCNKIGLLTLNYIIYKDTSISKPT